MSSDRSEQSEVADSVGEAWRKEGDGGRGAVAGPEPARAVLCTLPHFVCRKRAGVSDGASCDSVVPQTRSEVCALKQDPDSGVFSTKTETQDSLSSTTAAAVKPRNRTVLKTPHSADLAVPPQNRALTPGAAPVARRAGLLVGAGGALRQQWNAFIIYVSFLVWFFLGGGVSIW